MRFLKILLSLIAIIILIIIFGLAFQFFKSSNSILKVETPNFTSKVFLDEKLIGTTPLLKKNLRVGSHTLRLESEISSLDNKKVVFSKKISLTAQNITAINFDFGPNGAFSAGDVRSFQAGGGLSIITTSAKSDIWLDGELVGRGAVSIDPNRGIHKLRVGKSGFYTREMEINIESGSRLIVEVFLSENPFSEIAKLQEGQINSYEIAISASHTSLIDKPEIWAEGVFFYAKTKQMGFDALIDQNGKTYFQNKKSEAKIKAAKASTIGFLKADGQETTGAAKKAFENLAKNYQPAETTATTSSVEILQTPTGILNVRNGPGTAYAIIGQVSPGEKYKLLEDTSGWYKIKAAKEGWISSQYAKKL
ncbi:MAG: hypothetical protein A2172_00985 [Candidatus Woykebacteria bacterium RBG_13_40_15]|uniref:SH3b domain-containing protein n=1 Tax=Candidatus Woykebacteria bacterium RBG_13_40_15 TaxID=1802593 RepID=A0A1G1W8W1_9BACT|nr:MAG: hypothetical protein A2172_00985 [Candidatus Woykebacteria bacterium RBG_13_40_15]